MCVCVGGGQLLHAHKPLTSTLPPPPRSCVFESNLPLLRRLIQAGADANSADYVSGCAAVYV